MGYSADLLRIDTPSGQDAPIILEADRLPAVMDALRQAELHDGHISWCNQTTDYEARFPGNLPAIISAILCDYGWEETGADETGYPGSVALGWWGGEKLGSSWDGVLQAIAIGLDPDLRYDLIMSGEDGEMWAERIHAGNVLTLSVQMQVVEP